MSCKTEREQEELALRIIEYSRRRITHEAPILLGAVYALRVKPRDTPGPISTDGTHLWYHPERVLEDFRTGRERVAEQILHVTLHCLLGHPEVREGYCDPELFDVLADCKVAMFTSELGCRLGREWLFSVPGMVETGPTALPALYQRIDGRKRNRAYLLKEMADSPIRLDNHRLWNPKTLGQQPDGGGEGEKTDWDGIRRELCRQAEGTGWGHLPGHLKVHCAPSTENRISYSAFLKRFAAPRERLSCDPDSIDLRWYHLGLEQYGDIPLLEPCELSEPMVGDDLVIAMDTSGSCSGEICRRFLRETCNLLRDISAGASAFRVLLLQCDTGIRKERMVTTADDLTRLPEEFAPEGFGGTDFCPVFRRVEELRQEGVLPNVRGLIYLSDGYGDFPKGPPDYPVAFILADENGSPSDDLPDWVMALELQEEDFTLREVC